MARKVVLLADPGIDGAFALALALHDPQLDVLAVAATAGNVPAALATRNVHCLIEQFDPPKFPRVGAALATDYGLDNTALHGPGGLGGVEFPIATLHHPHPADKLIVDMVRNDPAEVTIVAMGPLTALACAFDREPELPRLVRQLVILGGAWHEPGNASAVAEFRFFCDALAARQVLRAAAPTMLIPLDTMRKALFSPTELLELPSGSAPTCQLLRRIVPFGIGASAHQFGIEGFYLQDVLGVLAVTAPEAFKFKPMTVDVETRGELTRGMSVFDQRSTHAMPNVDLAVDVDRKAVRHYMERSFATLSDEEE